MAMLNNQRVQCIALPLLRFLILIELYRIVMNCQMEDVTESASPAVTGVCLAPENHWKNLNQSEPFYKSTFTPETLQKKLKSNPYILYSLV